MRGLPVRVSQTLSGPRFLLPRGRWDDDAPRPVGTRERKNCNLKVPPRESRRARDGRKAFSQKHNVVGPADGRPKFS